MVFSTAFGPLSGLQSQFDQRWAQFGEAPPALVACSGGPDSVALLRLLVDGSRPDERISVAHFNHQLRGDAANQDEQFVGALCRQCGVRCIVGRADPSDLCASIAGQGLESAARRLRYAFLTQSAEQLGIRYVVTGHTADDQVETVMHNILRGTGLAGLAGIPAVRPLNPAVTLLRPLLDFSRSDLLAHLSELHQSYRHDEQNDERSFLRNRIRHDLLPLLEADYYPTVRESLTKLARNARDAQVAVHGLAEQQLAQSLISATPVGCRLDCGPLEKVVRHLRREVFVCLWQQQAWPLQDMTFDHWDRLAQMTLPDPAHVVMDFPSAIHVERCGEELSLDATMPDQT